MKQISPTLLVVLLAACTTPYQDWRPRTPDTMPLGNGPLPQGAARLTTPGAQPMTQPGAQPGAPPAAPGGAASSAEALELPPITLREAIEMALACSRGLQIADRRILIARNQVDEAYTMLIPRVNAEGRATARSNDIGGQFGDQKFVIGDQYVGTGKVEILVPIYTFGLVTSKVEAETLKGDAAELDADRARQDVVYAVSHAYYRVLEAQKIQTVVEESIKVVRRQYEIAQDFHAQGLVAKNDVLSAGVQLANREQQRIQAENNVQLAIATLNRLLRFGVNRRTSLVDVLEVEPWNGSFVSAVEVALRERPDLKSLERQVEIARAEYRVTRATNMPFVYGYGDYMYSSDSFLVNDDWFAGGLVLNVPIFDGLETHTKLKRKEKEIEQAIDIHDDRLDDVVLSVKQAYLNVRESSKRIPVARKSIEEAEENLRIIRDQYAEGWVTITDVLTEEERLSRARSNYYQALYDYHAAYAALVHEIGAEPPSEEPPGDGSRDTEE